MVFCKKLWHFLVYASTNKFDCFMYQIGRSTTCKELLDDEAIRRDSTIGVRVPTCPLPLYILYCTTVSKI